jgi:antitoxin FitA
MYNACMPVSVTIRDVPDSVRDELAARAARSGRSLQEFLRGELIDLASKPDVASLLERVTARKDKTGSSLSREKILSYRDSDRR